MIWTKRELLEKLDLFVDDQKFELKVEELMYGEVQVCLEDPDNDSRGICLGECDIEPS